jgi:hypothetical protein
LRDAAGVRAVLQPGEPRPAPPPRIGPRASAAGRATVEAFRALDDEVVRLSGGGLDLGTLATLGFFGAGALELAVTRKALCRPGFSSPGGASGPS